jgi:hypothetical protein
MIDFKCYLVRQFSERILLRHARRLLDAIDLKIQARNKNNILVMNLNVVKTACLLIEVLQVMSIRFNSLAVRSKQIRNKIIVLVTEYMFKVEQEAEMKYLLLEKDFELRDSLDLITRLQIVEFLESQYAENVVKEIWRGQYATQDSIFSASTNHMLTWHWWTCIRDVEAD